MLAYLPNNIRHVQNSNEDFNQDICASGWHKGHVEAWWEMPLPGSPMHIFCRALQFGPWYIVLSKNVLRQEGTDWSRPDPEGEEMKEVTNLKRNLFRFITPVLVVFKVFPLLYVVNSNPILLEKASISGVWSLVRGKIWPNGAARALEKYLLRFHGENREEPCDPGCSARKGCGYWWWTGWLQSWSML